MRKYTYNNLTWVDADAPTQADIVSLVKEYKLHPLVGEDILSGHSRPRVERYDDYIYMVLRIPIRSKIRGSKTEKFIVKEKEVAFIIGKTFIITTRHDTIEPLHSFSKIFETDSIIDKESVGNHAGFIFYYMMKKLYAHMEHDLESVRDSLLTAENDIFGGNERRMVEVLSDLSRELIDLKQASRVHKEVIDAFGPISNEFFGADFKYYSEDVIKEYTKIHEIVMNNRELLNDLRETNDSILSTKQNETMQIFTVVTSIIFSLDLIASIFSMGTINTPIVGMANGFQIIMGMMIVVTIVMFIYFKYKKWA